LVAVPVSHYCELELLCPTTQPAQEHQAVVIFVYFPGSESLC
jgi:hypothetical protein